MSVLNKLASALGERNTIPNKELAKQIVDKNDGKAITELVANLSNKSKTIQSDCIKTLYEIGERKPSLIAGHAKDFIALLDSKNNRMQWGAMTALSSIAGEVPETIYPALAKIVAIADSGSVITKDHCVKILTILSGMKQYANVAFPLLKEQIMNSPVNQLPTYAENALPVVPKDEHIQFATMLSQRLTDDMVYTKRKRLEKTISKLQRNK
ncbi:MAG: hypothetical protein ACTHJ0_08930 [Flavipsychrobacter sp.]